MCGLVGLAIINPNSTHSARRACGADGFRFAPCPGFYASNFVRPTVCSASRAETVCAEVNSGVPGLRFPSLCFPTALDRSLNTESRQIRADLHTMLKPLVSGFFSGALSRVCLVLSDPLGCVDGRLNVRSPEKGQGCRTAHSQAASLINRGPVVLRQSWRWTAPDNCFRTIAVFCVCLNVYSLSGMKS